MIYIAHRGLFAGPDKTLENTPAQIMTALERGYHVEIDLWAVEADLYLGHDEPQYAINASFINQPNLWIHAKNIEALDYLTQTTYFYFWHQNDDFTLTSNNLIWTYPGKPLTPRSVMVLPENIDPTLNNTKNVNCYGICSDYVALIEQGLTR
jgi:hypothetical protein